MTPSLRTIAPSQSLSERRIEWAERKPLVVWGEERGSFTRTLIAAFCWFVVLGFVCRLLWGAL